MDSNGIAVTGIAISAALALAAAVVGTWAVRRYGSHRGRLHIDLRAVEIIGRARLVKLDDPGGRDNEYVTEVGPDYGDPVHLLQVRIRNRGFHDISAESFCGKPLAFHLGGQTRATGALSLFGAFMPPPEPGARKLQIFPARIPKGAEWGFTAYTSGPPPHVIVSSPLADVDLKIKHHRPKSAGPGIVFDLPALYGYRKPRMMFGKGHQSY